MPEAFAPESVAVKVKLALVKAVGLLGKVLRETEGGLLSALYVTDVPEQLETLAARSVALPQNVVVELFETVTAIAKLPPTAIPSS
jgi:hypothetical protein